MDPSGTRCCQRKLILFLKYEDLKRDPSVHSKRLAGFLGQPFTQDEESDGGGVVLGIMKLCIFENLSNLEINKSSSPQFSFKNSDIFTKGKTGDWENYFTAEVAAALDHEIKEELHYSGFI